VDEKRRGRDERGGGRQSLVMHAPHYS
jgi:hypothetical protein